MGQHAAPVCGHSHVIQRIPSQYSACFVSLTRLEPCQRCPQRSITDLQSPAHPSRPALGPLPLSLGVS